MQQPKADPDAATLAESLLTASPDAIVVLDPAGHILRINPVAARLLGTANAIGRLITDLLPELESARPGHATIHRVSPAETWWDLTIAPNHVLIARDITEAVATRHTLALTEARLRTATETARSMFWIIRLDGSVAFTSQRWRDFTGIARPDITTDDWLPQIHPEDQKNVSNETKKFLAQEDAYEILFRARRADGAWRWLRHRAMPVLDAQRRLIEWAGFITDVTDIHEAGAQERLLRQLIDNHPNLISIAGSDRRLRYLNPAGREMIGIGPDADITDLFFDDYIAPSSQALLNDEALPTARDRGVWVGEMQLVNARTGALIDIHRITLSLHDEAGQHIGFGTVTRDITETKRAAAALAESEARFRNLVDAMPQMAFIAASDGTIEFVNRQWTNYGGTPQGHALGRDYVHPDDVAETIETWSHSLATGDTFVTEHRLRAIDGGYGWFLSRAVPLRDRIGTIIHWLGTSTDISEIVAAREATARSHADLERLVEERTRALTDAAHELVSEMQRREEMQAMLLQTRKLEALGQLTGGVAHDFNNILAAIMGSFSLIRRRTDSSAVLTQVERGEQAADRATALVRQLLTFARKQQLRPQVLDVRTVVSDTDTLIAHTIGRNVTRSIDIPSDIWPVLADPQQMEVALLNLAVNARDAMPDGGVMTVTARNLPAGECPRHLPVRDYVAIGVRDTGHGMPPDVAARAIEPFFTTKEPGKGTGLGLAMVHGFAEHSGGCLRIESQEGQGTLVEIVLARADQDIAPGTETLDSARHGDATILVVEDNEQIRFMTAGILRDLRYTVIEARNAEAAFALVHTLDRLDLVITDVVMPGADGPTLINRLRTERPGLPVLFLTGLVTDIFTPNEPTLHKPFTRSDLAAAVLDRLGRQATPASTPERQLLARIRAERLRDLYICWTDRHNGRYLPTTADIHLEPLDLWRNGFMVRADHQGETVDLRYHSAGEIITQRIGRPLVGESVNAIAGDVEVLGSLESAYRRCAKDRMPIYQFIRIDFGDGAPMRFERLLLPLSDDGRSITHLLGVALFDGNDD